MARVEDLSESLDDPRVRGHHISSELAFHSDRSDGIVLYCIRQARQGGESAVVSALQARAAVVAVSPELLAVLERPLRQDRRGDYAANEPPYCELPIFSCVDGVPVAHCLRRFIHDSQRHATAPWLTATPTAALDYFDAALDAEGAVHRMRLQAGAAPGLTKASRQQVLQSLLLRQFPQPAPSIASRFFGHHVTRPISLAGKLFA